MPKEIKDLKVGDLCWKIDHYDRRDKDLKECRVTKVGRTLITVSPTNSNWEQTFRMDTGKINNKYEGSSIIADFDYYNEQLEANRVAQIIARNFGYSKTSYPLYTLMQISEILKIDVSNKEKI